MVLRTWLRPSCGGEIVTVIREGLTPESHEAEYGNVPAYILGFRLTFCEGGGMRQHSREHHLVFFSFFSVVAA